MSLTKDRLVGDVADLATSDKVVSFITSASSDVITSSDVGSKKALDVSIAESVSFDVDLDHTEDSVRLGDGTNLTVVTANGELRVKDSDVLTELESIDGHVESIDGHVEDLAGCVDSARLKVIYYPESAIKSSAVTVGTDSSLLVATALSARKHIYIQNLANKDIFIGASDVSITNGLRIAKGATIEFAFGAAISLYVIGDTGITGSNNVRVLEIA